MLFEFRARFNQIMEPEEYPLACIASYCTGVVPHIGPWPTPWAYSTEKEPATTTTAR